MLVGLKRARRGKRHRKGVSSRRNRERLAPKIRRTSEYAGA